MSQLQVSDKSDLRPIAIPLKKDTAIIAATTLLLAFFVWLSIYKQNPPAVVSVSAPPTEFASGRAMRHLEVITKKPHPIGSPAHSAVRDYLLKELTAAGLNPEVQTTTAANADWPDSLHVGTVNNVLARLKGTDSTKAVMLVGHYDSKPISYGANDAGSAVVTMLETLRALQSGPPLKNDVIFLFTDGEEAGLLGARGFISEHPWVKDAGVVLNFEARGNGGPVYMFETSNQDGWLIREFAEAAPHPVAHSLAYEIYRLLPNDTDLTVFKEAGISALNFAYLDGLPYYHTLLDNYQNLDERSIQHEGSYALALARHFGSQDLQNTKESNAIYFNIFGSALVHYPSAWAMPLAGLSLVLFFGLVLFGLRRKRLRLFEIVLGFLSFLLTLIVSAGVATLTWRVVSRLHPKSAVMPRGETYNSDFYLAGFIALTVAVGSTLYVLYRKKISVENLTVGALLWWLIFAVATSILLPGASYLFTWPLLFSLAALWVWLARGRETISFGESLILLAGAIPGIVLLSPAIHELSIGLTLNFVGAVAVVLTLLLGLLIPQLKILAAPGKWVLPGAAAVAVLVILLVAVMTSHYSREHPGLDRLFYGLNADTGQAVWGSPDERLDEWTSAVFAANSERGTLKEFFYSYSGRKYFKRPAPALPIAAPEITLLESKVDNDVRTLRLHLASPRQANIVSLYVDSEGEMLKVSLDGKQVEDGSTQAAKERRNEWSMVYYAFPPGGVELVTEMKTTQPVKLRIVDQSYGLPEMPDRPFGARPANLIPAPGPFPTDTTLVSKSFTF
jgi:hypothetical protein